MFRKLYFILLLALLAACSGNAQKSFQDFEYPYEVKKIDLPNGSNVAYIDEGSGEKTIVLVHGLGGYILSWKKNIPELSKNYRVIALDLPGYGKSSKNAEFYTIPFFSETIYQFLEALLLDKVVLAGHSMGGQIAIYTAYTYPEKIESLVLAAPAGFELFTPEDHEWFKKYVSKEAIINTPEFMIRQTFQNTFYKFPEDAEFMANDRISVKGTKEFEDYANAYAQSVFAMLNEPVFDKLKGIKQPTLVVYGNQDGLIPNKLLHPELTTKMVADSGMAQLPNATLVMIDESGHFPIFEKSEAFNKTMIKFLKNNQSNK